jgi:hypothetical protein
MGHQKYAEEFGSSDIPSTLETEEAHRQNFLILTRWLRVTTSSPHDFGLETSDGDKVAWR